MMLFTSPTSLLNANILRNSSSSSILSQYVAQQPMAALDGLPPLFLNSSTAQKSTQPPLPQLALLVFEAVLEVVCVSLPGYIVARMGMFDADAQKFVANLNVVLFTPCLGMFDPNLINYIVVTYCLLMDRCSVHETRLPTDRR